MRKKINPEETVSISFEFILTIQYFAAKTDRRARGSSTTVGEAKQGAVHAVGRRVAVVPLRTSRYSRGLRP